MVGVTSDGRSVARLSGHKIGPREELSWLVLCANLCGNLKKKKRGGGPQKMKQQNQKLKSSVFIFCKLKLVKCDRTTSAAYVANLFLGVCITIRQCLSFRAWPQTILMAVRHSVLLCF